LPAKKSSLEIPEASHISTSENIFSCKLIEHIFAYKTQQDFGAKKYVVARGDTNDNIVYSIVLLLLSI
jgi:hypothetical protein